MIENDVVGQRDPEISSEQLHAYLRSKQWQEDGNIRNVATIWHRSDDLDLEILVPSKSARDYVPRIRQALSSIAAFEKRLISEVVKDVRLVLSNVITVRVIHDDTSGGTIPINDGVLLIAKAKELLSAAAQSVYSKRKQFSRSGSQEAKEYVSRLMLGQTEMGSYIVNVIAPPQPLVDLGDRTADAVPFSQVVTHNLVTSLEALERASAAYGESGDLKEFDTAVQSGASSNMCDALMGLSGEKRHRTFEITITGISVPMFESEPRKFAFDSRRVELLEKASGYYKNDYILHQRRLTGYIIKLIRPKDKTSGTVIIDAALGETERKIRVELTGDDYHMAVLAHDNSKLVRVEGDVYVKSKSAHLINPTNFGVIEVGELF